MALLPKPYYDEILGSIVLRGLALSGLPLKRFLRMVYATPRSNLSFVMSSGLDRIALLSGAEPEELLVNHTVFPYSVAAMPPQEQARLRGKALKPVAGVDCLASLTKSVTHGVSFRRFCPLCVAREMRESGESYWHRAHLLPGMVLCPEHGIRLQYATALVRGGHTERDPRLPNQCSGTQELANVERPLLDRVSALSLLALNGRFPGGAELPLRYGQMARDKGYVCGNGGIGSVHLSGDIYRAYGRCYLEAAGCEFAPGARNAWPALMTRVYAGVPFAPVKHILLTAFLEVANRAEVADRLYRTPGPKPRNPSRRDQRTAARLRLFMARHHDKDRRFSISKLLTRWKAWAAYRHDRSGFPETRAAIAEFKNSNLAERQTGRRPYWRKRPGLECRTAKAND